MKQFLYKCFMPQLINIYILIPLKFLILLTSLMYINYRKKQHNSQLFEKIVYTIGNKVRLEEVV
jgi:membrane-bound acyltransferase YfiQ involved in biofilm formation